MPSAYDKTSLRAIDSGVGLGNLVTIAVLALSVRALLAFQFAVAAQRGFARPTLATSLLLVAATIPFGILIHELGHLAAGLAAGQFCRKIVIGPVELARRGAGWRFRLVPLRRAGMVDLVPSAYGRFRARRTLCVLGGPAASLLSGAVFFALSLRAPGAISFWVLAFSAQMGLIGLLGLLPLRRDGARSDGSLLWELVRGGRALDDLQRDLLVASSQATPLRLRDWPRDLILRLGERPPEGAAGRYCAYLAYVHFLDCGDPETAGRYLDRLLEGWHAADPPEYALEAAYFFAAYRDNFTEARRWLALEERDAEPWVRLRARAAIDRALTGEALALLRAAPACGAHRYEIDRLTGL